MTTTHQLLTEATQAQIRSDLPTFRPGDTVRVAVRVVEGNKERTQNFEGICTRRKGGGVSETVTVRRVSFGVGIERTFPIHSPRIESIELVRPGRVRRSKLYYLRSLRGKAARIADLRDKPGRGTKIVTATDEGPKKKKRGSKAKAERRAGAAENAAPKAERKPRVKKVATKKKKGE